MNSRERIIKAIEFKKPDRIPIFRGDYGLRPLFWKYGDNFLNLLKKYPADLKWFGGNYSLETIPKANKDIAFHAKSTDVWGVTWERADPRIVGIPTVHPLSNWSKFKTYKLPDLPPDSGEKFEKEREKASEIKAQGGFVLVPLWTHSGSRLFEKLQELRGYENLMIDLIEERKELEELADMIVEFNLSLIKRAIKLGADMINFADDWGTQQALMINPSLWRKFFKPRYKRLFDAIHKGNAYVHFHSCGYTIEIIPDLIELGVDVLQCQSFLMKKELSQFAGKICFDLYGDRQGGIKHGFPDEFKKHIRHLIKMFGTEKGGIIGGSGVDPDLSLENLEAMLEAFIERKN
ncbi:hypothetical protein KAW08_02215 [bacterium]|nr:hypothetical protein [bacterium]